MRNYTIITAIDEYNHLQKMYRIFEDELYKRIPENDWPDFSDDSNELEMFSRMIGNRSNEAVNTIIEYGRHHKKFRTYDLITNEPDDLDDEEYENKELKDGDD